MKTHQLQYTGPFIRKKKGKLFRTTFSKQVSRLSLKIAAQKLEALLKHATATVDDVTPVQSSP